MDMEYKQVAIPKALSDRFAIIQRYFGYRSFSEMVVESVRQKVFDLETEHEASITEEKRKDEHE